jgi:hypothetical protein
MLIEFLFSSASHFPLRGLQDLELDGGASIFATYNELNLK